MTEISGLSSAAAGASLGARSGRSGAASLGTRVLDLIAAGQARSRTELTELTGAAASTISLTVQNLIGAGLVAEEGTGESTGGRPRKFLRIGGDSGYVVAADIGGNHARIGVVEAGGRPIDVSTIEFSINEGPEAGLSRLAIAFDALISARPAGSLRGIGIALPGPVDVVGGFVESPARMPGWNRFPVRDWLENRFPVPAIVDNDANLMALGEHAVHGPERQQSIMIKAGSAIGGGIIAGGTIYRGATGAAGDITHVRIDAAGTTPCTCGNTGCLDTVASGTALVRILNEAGVDVSTTAEVVALAADGHPLATRAVRDAGRYLGEVLSANVNFFNPNAVYLGGILSTLDPFVAAVRSQLYEGCHPLATQHLVIERTSLGADAGLVGAGSLALQHALTLALDALDRSAPLRHYPKRTERAYVPH
jgi:predicted NBD/HSP70 family sugar kinase